MHMPIPTHDAAEGAPDPETIVARLEIALLEVLMLAVRLRLRVAGEMDLPIFADYGAVPVDEDRGVEPALLISFMREFRVAEVETDAEFPGFFKERCGLRARHLFLIETVELGFVLDHPTRKESR